MLQQSGSCGKQKCNPTNSRFHTDHHYNISAMTQGEGDNCLEKVVTKLVSKYITFSRCREIRSYPIMNDSAPANLVPNLFQSLYQPVNKRTKQGVSCINLREMSGTQVSTSEILISSVCPRKGYSHTLLYYLYVKQYLRS